ncbi:MFS transporter [Actinopolyspora xinjiangensis]|uniref:MFS transporter n=1 Tax=Actinopolyspora xinjiangensis TaxID=405564 RepID=UPI001480EA4A|nr:MFS transporter [Actinopolyspora xinjiangensis]
MTHAEVVLRNNVAHCHRYHRFQQNDLGRLPGEIMIMPRTARRPGRSLPQRTVPLLITSRLIGQTGDRFTLLALPIFTVAAGATPAEAGLVFTVYAAPGIGAFLIGRPLDRTHRLRGICASAELLRAVLLLGLVLIIPRITSGGWLLVLVVTFACGCCSAVFDVGLQGYLPRAVSGLELRNVNSWFARAQAAADVAGPPAAGAVVAVAGSGTALLVDAASFLLSGLLLCGVKKQLAPAVPEQCKPTIGWSSGMTRLLSDTVLRNVVLTMLVLNFGGAMIGSLWVVYATESIGVGPTALGAITSFGGISALVSSVFIGKLTKDRNMVRWVTGGFVTSLLGLLCIPVAYLTAPVVFLIGFQVLFSASGLLVAVGAAVIRQERTPNDLQANVYGVVRTGQDIVLPLAGGAATVVASAASVPLAVLVGALTATIALPCVYTVYRSPFPAAPPRAV